MKKKDKINYEVTKKYLDKVSKFYSHNANHYHTIYHIQRLFEVYFFYREQFREEFPDLDEEILFNAIAWHDCVYIPGCPLNEEFSAQLYEKYFRENLIENNVLKCIQSTCVKSAILSTKVGNKNFTNPVEKVLHDLDWSSFCQAYCKFEEDTEKIRKEAMSGYRYKGTEVLKNQLNFYLSIIDKDIYVTKTFQWNNFEQTAHKNLEKRIVYLEWLLNECEVIKGH